MSNPVSVVMPKQEQESILGWSLINFDSFLAAAGCTNILPMIVPDGQFDAGCDRQSTSQERPIAPKSSAKPMLRGGESWEIRSTQDHPWLNHGATDNDQGK